MDLQLNGRTALVTGGSRGIGRAVVEALAAEGATVSFCARSADGVRTAEEELRGAGYDVYGSEVDVADGDALAAWVRESAAQRGGIDVVVANVSALAIPSTEENWAASFTTDMLGTVRLVEAALPSLEASDAGAIVTISSVSGREIDFAAGPYGTFKGAIVHYTQGLAYQLAGRVRANTVSPGNVYFPGGVWESIEQNDPDLYGHALGLNPTGRMATPQEVARAVTFLASPAATFISGTNLVVDGALTRGVQL
ncbi:SDR family NAD(P)-dependent oxidoreductase [Actinomycetospora chibensis]|jgi:NAD(P)-dependent dehydrogenase (short-subunit alcohol dehydrogenase family)|uniref:SDR family NAD(P)-dependent oxidoreductase n=1 Tax=Actinomycetospora chibensis TaxID=663606 RepID=A0ABV9RI62_9PSEU|nr:SDR family NAD(P)-dependent oxidoreductase [Actinomycetospora chibensis]MDD7922437.1 SDR family NAD(P)-dependent oxidoreductase [Actinomycetospora chibensis]